MLFITACGNGAVTPIVTTLSNETDNQTTPDSKEMTEPVTQTPINPTPISYDPPIILDFSNAIIIYYIFIKISRSIQV